MGSRFTDISIGGVGPQVGDQVPVVAVVGSDGRIAGGAASMQIRRYTIPAYDATNSTTQAASRVQVASANAKRRALRIINRGTSLAEYGFDASIAPGGGDASGGATWPIAQADAANGQGGGDDPSVPTDGAVWVVSSAGSVVVVMEG